MLYMNFLHTITLRDIVDILVVSVLVYYVLLLIRGTRGMQIAKGVLILIVVMFVCRFFGLQTVNWLLQALLYGIVVALPIVFQPELRRMLVSLGTGRGITDSFKKVVDVTMHVQTVDNILWSLEQLSDTKTGALIAIERQTGLEEYCETGTMLNADISAKLIFSIFNTKSPLHDGAVIIKDFRIAAASCYLPLSENVENKNKTGKKGYGTRHRAAIGLSEQTDAVVLIVSEETGNVSVAHNGRIVTVKDLEIIKNFLLNLYQNARNPVSLDFVLSEELSENAKISETKSQS